MSAIPTNAAASSLLALGPQWLDPNYLIPALGPFVLIGLSLIIFAECGLLVGFFLPGDSLLFTAGLFVATGVIDTPLWLLASLLIVCALAGNLCGYWIGRAAGPAIFDREDSRFFKQEYVTKTHDFFEKYGNRAIVLGRFVPIVRTFITVMAGVGKMDPKRYLTYSFIGGIAWAGGVTVLGYWLGSFTFVRDNIELILVGVVALSVCPLIVEFVRARRENRTARSTEQTEQTEVPEIG